MVWYRRSIKIQMVGSTVPRDEFLEKCSNHHVMIPKGERDLKSNPKLCGCV